MALILLHFVILQLQSTMDLKHSSVLNCHLSRISDKANCGGNLIGEGELHEIRSGEKAFRPSSNNKPQASSLCVPAGNVETSDVCFRQHSMEYSCTFELRISLIVETSCCFLYVRYHSAIQAPMGV